MNYETIYESNIKLTDPHRKTWELLHEETHDINNTITTLYNENKDKLIDSKEVLPTPPNDAEKYSYLNSNRWALVILNLGTVFCQLLSLVFLASTSKYFYFYFVYLALSFLYLLINFGYSIIVGRDYSYLTHLEIFSKAKDLGYFPTVDVFLPICGESLQILNNTWYYVQKLDYPNFKVHVLDDGAKDEVKSLAESYGFNYIRRDDRPKLKKAGNMRNAFNQTNGDFILVLDADFCPRTDMLKEIIPYMLDGTVGILQTPQYFKVDDNQTWIEQGIAISQEVFYRFVQVNRNIFDAAICVGTSALYRRAALEPLGGTAAVEHSEDVHTGLSVIKMGYKVRYIPIVLSCGCCPNTLKQYFNQQYRWCFGSMGLSVSSTLWFSNLNIIQKIIYFSGMIFYLYTTVSIIFLPISSMLIIYFAPNKAFYYNIYLSLPILFNGVFMRYWHVQRYTNNFIRVVNFQAYCYAFAIMDRLTLRHMPWIPTGNAKIAKNVRYVTVINVMLLWSSLVFYITVCGSIWRLQLYPYYHFLPTIFVSFYFYFHNLTFFAQ